MKRAMGIEPTSEAWASELIPRGHGPGSPQSRHVSVTVLKCGDSDQKRRQAQIICFWAGLRYSKYKAPRAHRDFPKRNFWPGITSCLPSPNRHCGVIRRSSYDAGDNLALKLHRLTIQG
jgi:hypothetical protein